MRIQNNIMAMNTHRMYTINNSNVAKSAEKLSSGYRINRAGDDAAGLAISEKMRAQVRGLNMASKNSQDAVSLIQTAEGALQEVHSMLQRMNELANQAATGTNETFDRQQIDAEFNQLKSEIDQVAETTTFNNMKLLDGSLASDAANVKVADTSTLAANKAIGPNYTVTGQTGLTNQVGTYAIKDLGNGKINVEFTDTKTLNKTNTEIDLNKAVSKDFGAGKSFKLDLSEAGLGIYEVTAGENAAATAAELAGALDTKGVTTTAITTGNGVATDISGAKITLNKAGISDGTNPMVGEIEFTFDKTNLDDIKIKMTVNGAQAGNDPDTEGIVSVNQITADDGSTFNVDPEKADRNANKTFTATFSDGANNHTVSFKVGEKGATVEDLENYLKGAYATAKSDGIQAAAPTDAFVTNATTAQALATATPDGAAGTAAVQGKIESALDMDALANVKLVSSNGTAFEDGENITFETRVNSDDKVEIWAAGANGGEMRIATSNNALAAVEEEAFGTAANTLELDFGTYGKINITGNVAGENAADDTSDFTLADLKTSFAVDIGAATQAANTYSAGDVKGVADPSAATNQGALKIQVGANEGEQLEISVAAMSAKGLGISASSISDQTKAGNAITATKKAIDTVSGQRATLGAMQNRLEHKIANLDNTAENLSSAESRIRDVDIAKEMTSFTKNNILSQAATAMLAQANSAPQGVLSLLQ